MYVVLSRGTPFVVYPAVVRFDSKSLTQTITTVARGFWLGSRTVCRITASRPRSNFPTSTCQRSSLRCDPPFPASCVAFATASCGDNGMIRRGPPDVNSWGKKIGKQSPTPPWGPFSGWQPPAGPSRPLDGRGARRYNEFEGLYPQGQARTALVSDFSSWPPRTH